MKNKKTLLNYLLVIALAIIFAISIVSITQMQNLNAYAEGEYRSEICYETDSVIITLTEEATRQFIAYTPKDFLEIDCNSVEDLTQFTVERVKNEIQGKFAADNMGANVEQFRRILRLELKEKNKENVLSAIKKLEKREDVLFAGPNYIYSIATTPNDTYYSQYQWGLKGTNGIEAPSAWDITTGLSSVTVGVLDTGIQASHPDLINRISTAGLHRDCTVNPITIVSNNSLNDPNGHGTHVAGIIGAQGNNGIGIAGVAWNIKLVSLRVFDENGNGNTESITRAINFADGQNIPILNFSGGGNSNDINMQNAIAGYAGLFVAAAGNGGPDGIGDDNDTTRIYPSDYSRGQTFSSRVISVGAIDANGERCSFSNYGAASVSLFAPGGHILSTYPQDKCTGVVVNTRWGDRLECEVVWSNRYGIWEWVPNGTIHHDNGYHFMDGTSMATPHVAGVAALMLSFDQNLTAAQLKAGIVENVMPINEQCESGGRLEAFCAIYGVASRIIYHQNGGNGDIPEQLAAHNSTVILNNATGFTRTGYYVYQWQTQPGTFSTTTGTSTAGSQYVLGASYMIADDVTLYAVWKPNQYTLTFNANGGSVSPTSKTVTYANNVGTLPTPTRSGYTFFRWDTQANGSGTKYTSSTVYNIDGNTTIYAIWGQTLTFTTSGEHNLNQNSIIYANCINLPTSVLYTKTFIIHSNVNEVTFKGSSSKTYSNTKIIVNSRTQPLTIRFWDMKIRGQATSHVLDASNAPELTIDAVGINNSITGGALYNNNDFYAAIRSGDSLTITGDKLVIVGPYAFSYNGMNGLEGGYGIFAFGTNMFGLAGINIQIDELNVTGGNGMFGSNGAQGSTGSTPAKATPGNVGTQGGTGGIGGTGGTGGNGGIAIFCYGPVNILSTSNVTVQGGTGGKGGAGGIGGTGGTGGEGGDYRFFWPATAQPGGKGGTGGRGGTGGTGGNGGNSIITAQIIGTITSYTSTPGVGGNAGAAGTAGLGGLGGFDKNGIRVASGAPGDPGSLGYVGVTGIGKGILLIT